MANLVAHPEQLEAVRDDRSPDPRRVRRDAALVAAGAHDHAAARGGRGALGRRSSRRAARSPASSARPTATTAASTGPRCSTSCAPTSTSVARVLRRRRPPRPSASDATSASGPCCRLFEIEVGVNDLLDAMTDIRFADGTPPPEPGCSPAPRAACTSSSRPQRRNDHDRTPPHREPPRQGLLGLRRGRPRPHRVLFTEDAPHRACASAATATWSARSRAATAIRALHADSMAAQTDQRRHNLSNLWFEKETDDAAIAVTNLTLLSIEDGAIRVLSSGWYRDQLVRPGRRLAHRATATSTSTSPTDHGQHRPHPREVGGADAARRRRRRHHHRAPHHLGRARRARPPPGQRAARAAASTAWRCSAATAWRSSPRTRSSTRRSTTRPGAPASSPSR